MGSATWQAVPKTHDIKRLIDVLRENGIVTETLEPFVDLNALAVQYRYEPLYGEEEPIDRLELAARIESLIDQVAAALRA